MGCEYCHYRSTILLTDFGLVILQDERSELRTTMLDEANSKRRKLDREKRVIDRPKTGESIIPLRGGDC